MGHLLDFHIRFRFGTFPSDLRRRSWLEFPAPANGNRRNQRRPGKEMPMTRRGVHCVVGCSAGKRSMSLFLDANQQGTVLGRKPHFFILMLLSVARLSRHVHSAFRIRQEAKAIDTLARGLGRLRSAGRMQPVQPVAGSLVFARVEGGLSSLLLSVFQPQVSVWVLRVVPLNSFLAARKPRFRVPWFWSRHRREGRAPWPIPRGACTFPVQSVSPLLREVRRSSQIESNRVDYFLTGVVPRSSEVFA